MKDQLRIDTDAERKRYEDDFHTIEIKLSNDF